LPQVKGALRKRYTAVSGGGTYDEVKSDYVEWGRFWKVESVAFENETSSFTQLRIYIEGPGYEHWLYEKQSPIGGKLYWSEEDFTMGAGERLVARFIGCTLGDKLVMYLNGYWEEVQASA